MCFSGNDWFSITYFFFQDFKRLNLSRFQHGGVNVTGFQLLDDPDPSVSHIRDDLYHMNNISHRQDSESEQLPLKVGTTLGKEKPCKHIYELKRLANVN